MFNKNSAVMRSGQGWKLWILFTVSPLVIVLGIWTEAHRDVLSRGEHGILSLVCLVLAAGSLAFLCRSIRCPSCGARWFWLAINEKPPGYRLGQLFTRPDCPVCRAVGRRR